MIGPKNIGRGPSPLGRQRPNKQGPGSFRPNKNPVAKSGFGPAPRKAPKVGAPAGKPGKGGGVNPNALFPTGPLTNRDFYNEMLAGERAQFGPLERQLNQEAAASDFRRTQEDPAWFAAYKQNLAQNQAQNQQAFANAQAQQQQFSAQEGAQDQAGRQALAAKLQADAASRGATFDPSVLDTGANAEAARQNTLASNNALTSQQGANSAVLMNNRQSLADLMQREAQQRELARAVNDIQGKQEELAQKIGDFRTQFRADTRDAERKFQLGQATISGANSRAQLAAKTSTANSKRSSATTLEGDQIRANVSRLNAQLQAATSAGNAALARKTRLQIAQADRRLHRWEHTHPQARAGKGGGGGGGGKPFG